MRLLIFLGFTALVTCLQAPLEAIAVGNELETQNLDPSLVLSLGQEIQVEIKKTLKSHQEQYDEKFASLENTCQESRKAEQEIEVITEEFEEQVQGLVIRFVDELLRFSEKAVETIEKNVTAALKVALTEIDVKLQPINGEISTLKDQLSSLVTQEEVGNLQTKLIDVTTNASAEIKAEVSHLVRKEDLVNHSTQVTSRLIDVSNLLENLTACTDAKLVQQVLEQTAEFDQELVELFEFLRESSQKSQCQETFEGIVEHLEGLTETMNGNQRTMSEIGDSVDDIQETFSTRLEELESATKEIIEGLNPPMPTTTTTTTTTPPPPTTEPTTKPPPECLDSNFVGSGRSLDVCNAAVRFRKCDLTFVAFHCCRSCTDAGLITTIPNYEASRQVPVFQALKKLRPT